MFILEGSTIMKSSYTKFLSAVKLTTQLTQTHVATLRLWTIVVTHTFRNLKNFNVAEKSHVYVTWPYQHEPPFLSHSQLPRPTVVTDLRFSWNRSFSISFVQRQLIKNRPWNEKSLHIQAESMHDDDSITSYHTHSRRLSEIHTHTHNVYA